MMTNIELLTNCVDLSNLKQLQLSGCKLTDNSLWQLSVELETLRQLNLEDNYITLKGVEYLSTLRSLEQLNLNQNFVDDRALEHFM